MKLSKKIISTIMILTLALSSLAGCAKKANVGNVPNPKVESSSQSVDETSDVITITDQIGRTVTLDKPAEKIVSSYYISTALLIALGQEDKLVGIEMKADTRELYKKAAPQLLELPAVGSGKGINIEETAALNPDVVIIPQKLKDSVPSFEELGIPVIVVDPETLENFEECVTILSKVSGSSETGEKLLSYYHEKMDYVTNLTKNLDNKAKVYIAAGSEYLSTCTSKMYQDKLIQMAGGINVSSELTDGYWAKISAEQLNIWNPDKIFAVSYAEYTLDDIKNDPALSEITAVKENNVYSFPSKLEPWDYPTPSSILGILYLTHMLYPDLISQEDYAKEAQNFYKEFFNIEVSNEELGLY